MGYKDSLFFLTGDLETIQKKERVIHIISIGLEKDRENFCFLKVHPRLNNSINYYTPHAWFAVLAVDSTIFLVSFNLYFKYPRNP